MLNPQTSNPNDFKVVEFVNSTNFDFTTDMGCMYDGRPIFGMSGFAGIKAGERLSLPYHIGQQLAVNLAKQSLIRVAPAHDPKDVNPTGTALWADESLESLKNSFLTDLYTNEKPVAMSETDKLIAQVAELNKLVRENLPNVPTKTEDGEETDEIASNYKDKAEVIAELKKRGISYDARAGKASLEKLLA